MYQFWKYSVCIAGMCKWGNTLMFLGVRVFTVDEVKHKYGMKDDRKEPCGHWIRITGTGMTYTHRGWIKPIGNWLKEITPLQQCVHLVPGSWYVNAIQLRGIGARWRYGWFRIRERTVWAWNIYLCQEIRKWSKNNREMSKGDRNQLEGSPNGYIQENLSININNDSGRL